MKFFFALFFVAMLSGFTSAQRVVRYELTIDHKMVHCSGKMAHGIAVNGQIPAPTLEFTEGVMAEIYVKNNVDEESSLHWHGILLPNEQDGVPYLTTTPIKPKGTHFFTFPIRQNGRRSQHNGSQPAGSFDHD